MKAVIKRNGKQAPFDKSKIENAILKAFCEMGNKGYVYDEDYARRTANEIADFIDNSLAFADPARVEDIQDAVENCLMDYDTEVAKAYIRYREVRKLIRNDSRRLMDEVTEKIKGKNVQNQNANMDEHSFGGRVGEAANAVMKYYALNYCMSKKTKENHEKNEVYVHDLDRYAVGMHNCLTIPFDKLLAEGFNTRQVDIRPANSASAALQLVAVIFQLQSLQQFGGVSASHIDWTMVPYIRKSFYKHYRDGLKYVEGVNQINKPSEDITCLSIEDRTWYIPEYPKAYKYAMDMTEREVHQGVEALGHNLNSLQSRSGNQLR